MARPGRRAVPDPPSLFSTATRTTTSKWEPQQDRTLRADGTSGENCRKAAPSLPRLQHSNTLQEHNEGPHAAVAVRKEDEGAHARPVVVRVTFPLAASRPALHLPLGRDRSVPAPWYHPLASRRWPAGGDRERRRRLVRPSPRSLRARPW